MKHRLPWVIAHSGLNEVIDVSGYIEIDDDGLSATIHSKVYGFKRETEVFFGYTFRELESDMETSNYPFDTLMDKVRTLRYWPRLKKRIEQEESDLKQEAKESGERAKRGSLMGSVVAQNTDGSIKLGSRRIWVSYYAVKTVILKNGKELETTGLGCGPIWQVKYDPNSDSFTGIVGTREGDYNFEIEAATGKTIRRDPI